MYKDSKLWIVLSNNKYLHDMYMISVGKLLDGIKLAKIKKEYKKYGKEVLKILTETLNNKEFKYFAAFGTLLGFIREGAPLEHDLDFDFGIINNETFSWEIFSETLIKNGFIIKRWITYNKYIFEVSFYYKKYKNINIDFFSFTKEGESYIKYGCLNCNDVKYPFRNAQSLFKEKLPYFENITFYKYNNIYIPIPENYKDLLKASYTESWSIKNKNWNVFDKPNDKRVDGCLAIINIPKNGLSFETK